jgi:hypothetical protein
MTKTLPGLGAPLHRPEDPRQDIARRTMLAVDGLLLNICMIESTGEPVGDGGPMLAGAVGGLVKFAMRSGLDDIAIKANIIENVDSILAQLRMDEATGAARPGHA